MHEGRKALIPGKRPTRTYVLTVIGQMKRAVSKKAEKPIWQRSFHDHVIRDRADYEKIAEYIRQNPARWQLDRYYTEV